ncbi:Caspase domain-containing protein [Fibrobacter sp. UWCM]|nr:Caspase domain-containing protein [Fibrobacter sp. UWCM]
MYVELSSRKTTFTRMAVLIQAPLNGKDYLDGVRKDIACWKRHLMSLEGGAWHSSEIYELKHPSKENLIQVMTLARDCDFAIVAFSGHGFIKKDKLGFPKTWVYINESEDQNECVVPEMLLNPGTPRCLISLDCCRQYEKKSTIVESMASFSKISESMEKYYRKLYESKIVKCEKGCCKLYGVSINEEASDEESFTQVLMAVADLYKEKRESASIKECMIETKKYFEENNPQQNPSYNGGRRLNHFPFVIGE